jgi:hypothetical protein
MEMISEKKNALYGAGATTRDHGGFAPMPSQSLSIDMPE